MADEQIKIRLDVDTIDGVKSLDELNEITKETGDSLGTLEKRAELLKKELEGVAIGTEEFTKLRNELRDVESELKDIDLAFEALDFEQRLTAATDTLTGVAGGFSAVQGSIALAGAESAEFEETMLRVQGAMALAMGVRDIGNAVAAMRKLNVASKVAAASQWALNAAMNANPIAIITVAVAGLVAAFKPLRDIVVGSVVKGFKMLTDVFAPLTNAVKGFATGTIKTAKVALKGLYDFAIKPVIDGLKAFNRALGNGVPIGKRAIKNLENLTKKLREQEAAQKAVNNVQQEGIRTILGVLDKALKKEQEITEKKIESLDWEMEKRRAAGQDVSFVEGEKIRILKESALEQIRITQARIDQLAKLEGGWSKVQEVAARGRVKRLKSEFDELEKQEELFNIRQQKRRSEAADKRRQQEEDEAKKRQEAFIKRRDEEAARTKEIEQINLDDANAQREAARQKDLNNYLAYQKALGEANAKRIKDDLDNEMAVQAAKAQLLDDSLNAIAAQLEEGSKAAKAVAAAQVVIDTWRGAQAAFASAQANPLTSVFPAYPFIQAGLAVSFGVANLRKLLATDPSGASSIGGAPTGATAAATGGVPIAPTAGSTIIDGNNDNQQDEPVRVFVTEADITNTQNNVGAIVSQATI